MRQNARDKASRLLTEGRVICRYVDRTRAIAFVRGEGVIHRTAFEHGSWTCSCPARTDQCSHLYALRRIVAVDLNPNAVNQ